MAFPPPQVYKRILDSMMSSIHRLEAGQEYKYEREYTDAELREVTPTELM
jgi:hypothetical protein